MSFNIKITDDNLERDGAWVDWAMGDGVRVKLRRSTTPATQKHLQLLLKKNRKAIRNDKAQKEVMTQFLSTNVIVDWEGITENGEDYPYTVDNAIAILTSVEDFYNWILAESQDILNFAEDEESTLEERGEELKKS